MLVALLLSAPVVLSYQGSLESEPADVWLTSHDPGATTLVANDGARLRKAADPASELVAELPIGTKVKVVARSELRARIDQRVDHWYEVETEGARGFLFGGTLSPAVFTFDFDGDAEPEHVSVTWTWDFKLKLRVVEPSLPPGARERSILVEPTGQAYNCCGGTATIELVERRVAGIALVSLATSVEACADFGTSWVSYTAPRRGEAGELAIALRAAGLADAPAYADFKVRFDPNRRTALVLTESGVEGEGGREDVTKSRTLYRLSKGRFVAVKR